VFLFHAKYGVFLTFVKTSFLIYNGFSEIPPFHSLIAQTAELPSNPYFTSRRFYYTRNAQIEVKLPKQQQNYPAGGAFFRSFSLNTRHRHISGYSYSIPSNRIDEAFLTYKKSAVFRDKAREVIDVKKTALIRYLLYIRPEPNRGFASSSRLKLIERVTLTPTSRLN
jgi:hypothetical protein